MWGGGFLKQASDTSKYNHDLLRKTKDKKANTTSKQISESAGELKFKTVSELERAQMLDKLLKSNRADFRKKMLILLIVTLVIVTCAVLILN